MAVNSPDYRANAVLHRDPTRTTMLRAQYMREFGVRFRRIKGLVNRTIVDNDALRLKDHRRIQLFQAEPATDFGPLGDAAKVAAFMVWLRGVTKTEVLGKDDQQQETQYRWQRAFVVAAYVRGLTAADAALTRLGIEISLELARGGEAAAAMQSPHRQAVELLLQRNLSELEGVTEAMAQQIQRELINGLQQGWNPRKVARAINDRVDKIGLTRARVIARTETIAAHAEATLNRYEQLGIEGVTARVEFSTAGDGRVCARCEGLEGRVMAVADARGIIPVHPNCRERCAWLPHIAGVVVNVGWQRVIVAA